MKILIFIFSFFSAIYCFNTFAKEINTTNIGDRISHSCETANSRSSNSIVIPGAQVFYNDDIHVIATDGANLNTSIDRSSQTYVYPVLLPVGSSIKSITAYLDLAEDHRTSIHLRLEHRPLSQTYSDSEPFYFSTGNDGYHALPYTTVEANAGMNCAAVDGNGGSITVEAGYVYYLVLQVRTENTSRTVGEITMSGLQINY